MNSIECAIRTAKALFYRNKVSGSSANMSIKINNDIYITRSGSCFGCLEENDFVNVALNDNRIKPSKELPLHQYLFEHNPNIQAIIHTHSTYSTLASSIYKSGNDGFVDIPSPTPYLKMKVGNIGWVDYAKPGSKELFEKFCEGLINDCDAYLLKNHGVIIGSDNIMDAFYKVEEFEEACKNSFLLKLYGGNNNYVRE